MESRNNLSIFGLMLALGLVVSSYLVSDAVRDVKMSHQIIKVRGYAEVEAEADFVVWKVTLAARGTRLADSYEVLEKSRAEALAFLEERTIAANAVQLQAVRTQEIKGRDEKGRSTNAVEGYRLTQNVEVSSSDVHLVARVATEISDLIKQGIEIQATEPAYYYSGVNDLKSQLLVAATEDARERARTLAEGSGVRLGALKAARQGAFSVRSASATSISSEQAFDDVSSIAKKVTAVVTVDYAMR